MNFKKRNKQIHIIQLSISVLVLGLTVFIFLGLYSRKLEAIEIERLESELTASSNQSAELIQSQLDSAREALIICGGFLEHIEHDITNEQVLAMLKNTLENSRFAHIGIAGPMGNALDTKYSDLNISDQRYFQESMKGKIHITNITESQEDSLSFAISVPVMQNNQAAAVIYGIIEMESLSLNYDESVDDSHKHFHVIDSRGNYLIHSDNVNTSNSFDNVWEELEQAEFTSQTGLEELKELVADKQEGLLSFKVQESSYYMYFAPLNVNDWYILNVSTDAFLTEHTEKLMNEVILVTVEIGITMAAVLTMLAYYIYRQYEETRKQNEELQVAYEIFNVATMEVSNCIFEYDMHSKQFIFKNKNYLFDRYGKVLKNVPQCFIDMNHVNEQSVQDFLALFEQNKNGAEKCSATISYHLDDFDGWERITLRNIFDNKKRIIRTIGIIEEITEIKEHELLIEKEDKFKTAALQHVLNRFEINVSKDVFEWNGEKIKYSDNLSKFIEKYIYEEDFNRMKEVAALDYIKNRFNQGDYKIEFRLKDENTGYHWIETRFHLDKDLNGDLIAYGVTHDIHKQKIHELELRYVAEHDDLTQILSRRACVNSVNQFLKNNIDSAIHAFMILDLDNFKKINDCHGHQKGDLFLMEVARKLQEYYRNTDIIGRLGGDEFILFLKDVKNAEIACKLAEKLVKGIYCVYDENGITISASVGIALVPEHGTDFEQLYAKADEVLYDVKKEQGNGYKIYGCESVIHYPADDQAVNEK